MGKRNINLDLIKIIACICVVGLHAVGMNNYTIYYLCDCGVPLFFMVDGYLLLSRENIDYHYAFHKIFHVLKIVFCWNLLILVPVLLFRHKLVNPFRLVLDSMLQKGYLWHFWFFGSLLIIYLLLPLFHKAFFEKKHYHRVSCLLFMFICLCIHTLSMIKGFPLHAFVPQSLRLWSWLFYFLLGGLFFSSASKLQRLSIWTHAALLIVFTIINNVMEKKIGLYLIHDRLAENFYDDITSIIWYSLLFAFLLRIPIKESFSRIITDLSNLTMGIFIIHPILLTALNAVYMPKGNVSVIIFWIGLTLISFIITYIISRIPVVKELVKL